MFHTQIQPMVSKTETRPQSSFGPFGQDDPAAKPMSLKADLGLLGATLSAALEGRQLQPLLLG